MEVSVISYVPETRRVEKGRGKEGKKKRVELAVQTRGVNADAQKEVSFPASCDQARQERKDTNAYRAE